MDWKLLTKDTIKSILRTHHECVNKFEGSRSQFSVEVLPFFIYYWNLQFLNNVNPIKTKVLLPQACVNLADVGYTV